MYRNHCVFPPEANPALQFIKQHTGFKEDLAAIEAAADGFANLRALFRASEQRPIAIQVQGGVDDGWDYYPLENFPYPNRQVCYPYLTSARLWAKTRHLPGPPAMVAFGEKTAELLDAAVYEEPIDDPTSIAHVLRVYSDLVSATHCNFGGGRLSVCGWNNAAWPITPENLFAHPAAVIERRRANSWQKVLRHPAP